MKIEIKFHFAPCEFVVPSPAPNKYDTCEMSTEYRNSIFKYRFFLFIAWSLYSALLYSKSRGFLNETQKPQLDDNGPSLIAPSFSSLSGGTPFKEGAPLSSL